jgi:hypothetical protein
VELLSLSPEVRSQVRDNITTCCILKEVVAGLMVLQNEDTEDTDIFHLSQIANSVTPFAVQNAHHRTLLIGSFIFIVENSIEAYYQSLNPRELLDLKHLVVAIESTSIRSIFTLINNSQKKECILDPGCQVITMLETTCHKLDLIYDPAIVVSTNGNIDPSLGLSHNVLFQIRSITIYLQVHIVWSLSYDILLGQPFDVLMESVVHNFANTDQTIIISDPNTGKQVTVPTLPRVKEEISSQDF